jgi:hypothetical protein
MVTILRLEHDEFSNSVASSAWKVKRNNISLFAFLSILQLYNGRIGLASAKRKMGLQRVEKPWPFGGIHHRVLFRFFRSTTGRCSDVGQLHHGFQLLQCGSSTDHRWRRDYMTMVQQQGSVDHP